MIGHACLCERNTHGRTRSLASRCQLPSQVKMFFQLTAHRCVLPSLASDMPWPSTCRIVFTRKHSLPCQRSLHFAHFGGTPSWNQQFARSNLPHSTEKPVEGIGLWPAAAANCFLTERRSAHKQLRLRPYVPRTLSRILINTANRVIFCYLCWHLICGQQHCCRLCQQSPPHQ